MTTKVHIINGGPDRILIRHGNQLRELRPGEHHEAHTWLNQTIEIIEHPLPPAPSQGDVYGSRG